eukprot:TRINITY_DN59144_c2_g1_i2.p1 TRINITY_DN59144_c2_g1~~TRINITY_DN59144_c2_g1_i2.p1  ORF type:complete len:367 (-),score=-9.83 TRINITY_DN59144_c2_g1_i2:125-1225(-)
MVKVTKVQKFHECIRLNFYLIFRIYCQCLHVYFQNNIQFIYFVWINLDKFKRLTVSYWGGVKSTKFLHLFRYFIYLFELDVQGVNLYSLNAPSLYLALSLCVQLSIQKRIIQTRFQTQSLFQLLGYLLDSSQILSIRLCALYACIVSYVQVCAQRLSGIEIQLFEFEVQVQERCVSVFCVLQQVQEFVRKGGRKKKKELNKKEKKSRGLSFCFFQLEYFHVIFLSIFVVFFKFLRSFSTFLLNVLSIGYKVLCIGLVGFKQFQIHSKQNEIILRQYYYISKNILKIQQIIIIIGCVYNFFTLFWGFMYRWPTMSQRDLIFQIYVVFKNCLLRWQVEKYIWDVSLEECQLILSSTKDMIYISLYILN